MEVEQNHSCPLFLRAASGQDLLSAVAFPLW